MVPKVWVLKELSSLKFLTCVCVCVCVEEKLSKTFLTYVCDQFCLKIDIDIHSCFHRRMLSYLKWNFHFRLIIHYKTE